MSLFKKIRTDLLDLMGEDDGSDAGDMAASAINRYYFNILALTNQDMEFREVTLTTVSGTRDYGLPIDVKEIRNIDDPTNKRSLREITQKQWRQRYPGTTDSGPPTHYYTLRRVGAQTQPATAETLNIVSSSALDTTTKFLRIRGKDTNEIAISEQVTLTGTVAVTTTLSYSFIDQITLSKSDNSAFAGYVTVSGTTSTTTFSIIPAGNDAPRYSWVRFHPNPGSAITYTIDARATKSRLVNDDDVPDFDEDFHSLLITGPASELLSVVGKEELGAQYRKEYDDMLDFYKGVQGRRPNRVISLPNVTLGGAFDDRPLIPGVDYV